MNAPFQQFFPFMPAGDVASLVWAIFSPHSLGEIPSPLRRENLSAVILLPVALHCLNPNPARSIMLILPLRH